MSEQYCAVSKLLHDLEWWRHVTIHRALRDSDVYFGQPPILDVLAERGVCTQNELAKTLNVSPASVAVSLRRMQKSGLIEKEADAEDLRRNFVRLTEKGKAQHAHIHKCFEEIDRKLYAGFTENELAALRNMLLRLCGNLAADLPKTQALDDLIKEEFCAGGDPYHGQTD